MKAKERYTCYVEEIVLANLVKVKKKDIDIRKYGPCPGCFGWVQLASLKRHMHTCDTNVSSSNRSLVVQSDIIVGRLPAEASQALISEVFPIMMNDKISAIVKQDALIVNLGNQWLMRNRGNEIMRKYYTSSSLRLAAKLKVGCQKLTGTNLDMADFFTPKLFETVIKATLACCHVEELKEEDLKAPSNAIKLGFDIKRMLNAKLTTAIITNAVTSQKEAQDFLRLMEMQWGLRVTKLARSLLIERSYNQHNKLPLPSDVKKMADFLQQEISSLNFDDFSFVNFKKAVVLTLSRITLFNRRRCHEVQAMRLTSYAARKMRVDEVDQEMRGELTDFERQLLTRQEIVVLRGKTGRGVPVILPTDVKQALRFLTDPEVRVQAGIPLDNRYVFANNGAGVFSAYDAIREITRSPEADLQMPDLVRTSNMRKYMATMLQALDTTEGERQWVVDHLGHTMDVHRVHYRQTSDLLERVDVAKILLIQDMGLVSKYRGKRIEDIQLEGLFPDDEEPLPKNPGSSEEAEVASLLDQAETETTDIPEQLNNDDDDSDGEDGEFMPATRKRKKPAKTLRQRWSEEEVSELMELFAAEFETNTLPGQKQIEKVMRKSLQNEGVIHKRKRDTIKKKLSNMMISRRGGK